MYKLFSLQIFTSLLNCSTKEFTKCNSLSQPLNQLAILREFVIVSFHRLFTEKRWKFSCCFSIWTHIELNLNGCEFEIRPRPSNTLFMLILRNNCFRFYNYFRIASPEWRRKFAVFPPSFTREITKFATFSTLHRKWRQMKKRFSYQKIYGRTIPWKAGGD